MTTDVAAGTGAPHSQINRVAALTFASVKGAERSRTPIESNTAFEIAEGITAAEGSQGFSFGRSISSITTSGTARKLMIGYLAQSRLVTFERSQASSSSRVRLTVWITLLSPSGLMIWPQSWTTLLPALGLPSVARTSLSRGSDIVACALVPTVSRLSVVPPGVGSVNSFTLALPETPVARLGAHAVPPGPKVRAAGAAPVIVQRGGNGSVSHPAPGGRGWHPAPGRVREWNGV